MYTNDYFLFSNLERGKLICMLIWRFHPVDVKSRAGSGTATKRGLN
jgi:hypothetical protein